MNNLLKRIRLVTIFAVLVVACCGLNAFATETSDKQAEKKVKACVYMSLDDAIKVAQENKYIYYYETESIVDSSVGYVTQVKITDSGNREVTFIFDSAENIQAHMSTYVDGMIGKTLSKYSKLEKQYNCKCAFKNYKGKIIKVKKKDLKKYQITGFDSFDFNKKQMIINVDTNKHIKKLKEKAEKERYEQEQARKAEEARIAAEQKATEEAEARKNKKVYVTPSGTKYHNANCWTIKKDKIEVTLEQAVNDNYEECNYCHPGTL